MPGNSRETACAMRESAVKMSLGGFMAEPSKGYFRLFPGNTVRLKYGWVVRCTGYSKDSSGHVTEVHCDYLEDSKSGTPGADKHKVKGVIHWVSAAQAHACEIHL